MTTRTDRRIALIVTLIAAVALIWPMHAQVNPITFDGLAPTTTRGDLIQRGASGNVRLAIGANHTSVHSNGTDNLYALNDLTTDVSGALPIANGGTANITAAAGFDALAPTTTQGDVIFRSSTTNARLGTGTAGQFLRAGGSGANPSWQSGGGAPFQFLGGVTGAGYPPADSTPFYVLSGIGVLGGNPVIVAPTAANYTTPIATVPLTITRIDMLIAVAGTPGSGETGSMAIRVNDTTDTVVFNNNLVWTSSLTYLSVVNVSIPAGQFFIPKITPPAWATNPTGTFYVIDVYVSPT